jgi:hypothetical protein
MYIPKIFSLASCIILLTACQSISKQQTIPDPVLGVKVYKIDADVDQTFNEWSALGINMVFADVSLLTEEFRTLAKQYNIKVFIILPVFYDPEALNRDTSLYAITGAGERAVDDWVQFVCPSREDYRAGKIDSISKLVAELEPDGISLDFIRCFCFWEMVYPDKDPESLPNTCFNEHCLQHFQKDTRISIPDSMTGIPEQAHWIRMNYYEEWTAWKCNLITSFVKEVSAEARKIKPGILVNVHAVPWQQDDYDNAIRHVIGQDFPGISEYVDMISPMTYAHMVKRQPSWIYYVVKDLDNQIDTRIIPSIQVNKDYLDEPLTTEEFEQYILEAMKPPSSGVIFWSWEQLMVSPEKKAVVQKLIQELI